MNEVYHGGPEGPAPPSVEHIRESEPSPRAATALVQPEKLT